MITQKPISLKVDIDTLDRLDNFIKDDIHWTSRNREINRSIKFYLDYQVAKHQYNYQGDAEKMRKFLKEYFGSSVRELFPKA